MQVISIAYFNFNFCAAFDALRSMLKPTDSRDNVAIAMDLAFADERYAPIDTILTRQLFARDFESTRIHNAAIDAMKAQAA